MTRRSSTQPERMKIQIIVLFQNLGEDNPYYAQSPAPPLPVASRGGIVDARRPLAPVCLILI